MNTEWYILIGVLIAPVGIWLLLSYPWFAIAMLLMVPLVKPAAVTYVPFFRFVDLTVLVNVVVGLVGIWAYMRSRDTNEKLYIPWSMLFCIGTVALVFVVGLLWTPAPDYGAQKLQRFMGIGLPFLVLPAFFIRSTRHGMGVLHILIIVSALVAFMLIFEPQSVLEAKRYGIHYGRRTFFGSDPNTPAVVIIVGMLPLLMAISTGVASKWLKLFGFVLFPLCLAAILVSGSRANLLGLFISLLFLPFLSKGTLSNKGLFLLLLFTSGIILIAFLLPSMEGQIPVERWLGFSDQLQKGDLASSRTQAWIFCLENAWDKYFFLGHGPGSYAFDFLKKDAALWPHNIVLEALYEAGIVGFIAIFTFFVLCVHTAWRGMRSSRTAEDRLLVAAPIAIVLSVTVTALTHWNLDGARFLYLFAGILHASVAQVVKQSRITDDRKTQNERSLQ